MICVADATMEEMIERLNASYGTVLRNQWTLPCKISFRSPEFYNEKERFKNMWMCSYDKENWFCIESVELVHLVDKLEKKERVKPGFNLYKKPFTIRLLEQLTISCYSEMHVLCILQWQCVIKNEKGERVTCINNKYGTRYSHSDSSYNFDVCFLGKENSKNIHYCPFDTLIKMLAERGFIKRQFYCASCFRINSDTKEKLLRCSRCKNVYYCNKECQTMDWKSKHRLHCK